MGLPVGRRVVVTGIGLVTCLGEKHKKYLSNNLIYAMFIGLFLSLFGVPNNCILLSPTIMLDTKFLQTQILDYYQHKEINFKLLLYNYER